jgi:hypothetical protein
VQHLETRELIMVMLVIVETGGGPRGLLDHRSFAA